MAKAQGCFYCDEHHEKRESIMFLVGKLSASTVYLFRDQSHKGRCVVALDDHKKEVFELTDEQRAGIIGDVSKVAAAPRSTLARLAIPTRTCISISSRNTKAGWILAAASRSPARTRTRWFSARQNTMK